MKVSLVSITKPLVEGVSTAEEFVTFAARVSNPENQLNTETAPRLIKYLITHQHWSPFEMVSCAFEIETSRAIAAQILRHRSFTFQEFSQRYSTADLGFEDFEPRVQGSTNRQVGDAPSTGDVTDKWSRLVERSRAVAADAYRDALFLGIAREQARSLLPLSVTTRLYMSGTLRSWIHYVNLRTKVDTQKEHRMIAEEVKVQLKAQFPATSEALAW